ncbi:GNAT family N-acetyltransferase [Asticcacaulis sp. EMRT-3]|uniref:GNAT family N-acetyltransferase n=1 Tax=Asticcacaulis sp. EMRT-3 TaxID=3040349 RepID=UPI0024AF3E58|nr:GNAT family N-acetyltransferase [Asticcacaulis sp. EMRT-3]MDI7774907.1 GNAT family N-acetyltransferase [Asticcacaulis sp. EMRT-3]
MADMRIRAVRSDDYAQWRVLWDAYNTFYGRTGDLVLPEAVTQTTWARCLDPGEPVFALISESAGRITGFAHYLFHRSTSAVADSCYLQDLFVGRAGRRQGAGRALVLAVCAAAEAADSPRLYWHTQAHNRAARRLYDQVARKSAFIVYRREV